MIEMDKKRKLQLKAEFKKDVCDRSKEIDPDEQLMWFELSYGYFLAKGCTPDEAYKLSSEVRYQDEYFEEPAPAMECTKCGTRTIPVEEGVKIPDKCPNCGGKLKKFELSKDRQRIEKLRYPKKSKGGA